MSYSTQLTSIKVEALNTHVLTLIQPVRVQTNLRCPRPVTQHSQPCIHAYLTYKASTRNSLSSTPLLRAPPVACTKTNYVQHYTNLGHLYAFNADLDDVFKLSVWILEDYDTDNWILKHNINSLEVFGGNRYRLDFDYQLIAVHPECNLIFFIYGWQNTLMSYEMDRKEVRFIRHLGHDSRHPYLPYVFLVTGGHHRREFAGECARFPAILRAQQRSDAPSKADQRIERLQLHLMENRAMKRNQAPPSLTDELIVEILSRLPVRSVCQFKCVCRSWRKLIADHENRKKLPQTLSGFLYKSWNHERCPESAHHFTNVTGKGQPLIYPSFSFLPSCDSVFVLDCCNGLFLCKCYVSRGTMQFHYAVCNPATKEWVVLPDANWGADENRIACLCFDPAITSHFHVLEYLQDEADDCVRAVEIYSSKTELWTLHESGWPDEAVVCVGSNGRSVFLNGCLHSLTLVDGIAVVDMEGKKWRQIPMPDPDYDVGIIHQSQGHLYAFSTDLNNIFKLSVWILEDYNTDNWILKHTVSSSMLFGGKRYWFDIDYQVIAVHPECNLIFFVYGKHNTLMAYEMDRKEVRVIRNLGHESHQPYLPCVPLFSKSLAGGC
uniref:F-box domain-containing protein n=1 Tax=Leersia perrieri TaxID=77586 RepID=A0A0D9WZU2_9ORYZ